MRQVTTVLAVVATVAAVVAVAPTGAGARAAGPVPATDASTAPGTLVLTGRTTEGCPPASRCWRFAVTCAAPHDTVPPMTGAIALGRYTAPRRGTLVAFGGGGGQDHWLAGSGSRDVRRPIAEAGIEIAAVAWDEPWNVGTAGLAALSCRAATVVAWAAARDAAGGATPPAGTGVCGVCVIGYSAGASQAAGAVAFHDVAAAVDAVIPVAGPISADIGAGCRREGSPAQYLEPDRSSARRRVDDSFDAGDPSTGACSAVPADLTATAAWDANSLVPSGRLHFPATRFSFVWGSRDRTGSAGQGIAHLAALADAGSPLLDHACVDAHHDVFELDAGVDAIVAAVLWLPGDGLSVPPVPVASATNPRCTPT